MTRRSDEERRAIEESAAELPSPRHPGTIPDFCAMCRSRVMAHDRAWEGMWTTWGLVLAANYCGADCFDEATLLYPEAVAEEMRSRPGWRGMEVE